MTIQCTIALDTLKAVNAPRTRLSHLGLEDADLMRHTFVISVSSYCSPVNEQQLKKQRELQTVTPTVLQVTFVHNLRNGRDH